MEFIYNSIYVLNLKYTLKIKGRKEVMQMEKKRPYIGVDAIIQNKEGKVLLIHRTGKNFNGYWGLISGMVEWGETLETALKREVMEEIGVEIEIIRYTGRYYDKIGRHPSKTVICHPHICRIVNGVPSPISECDEVKWYDPEEIKGMVLAYDHIQMLKDEGIIK